MALRKLDIRARNVLRVREPERANDSTGADFDRVPKSWESPVERNDGPRREVEIRRFRSHRSSRRP